MLKISNLSVSIENKLIIDNLDLEIYWEKSCYNGTEWLRKINAF